MLTSYEKQVLQKYKTTIDYKKDPKTAAKEAQRLCQEMKATERNSSYFSDLEPLKPWTLQALLSLKTSEEKDECVTLDIDLLDW